MAPFAPHRALRENTCALLLPLEPIGLAAAPAPRLARQRTIALPLRLVRFCLTAAALLACLLEVAAVSTGRAEGLDAAVAEVAAAEKLRRDRVQVLQKRRAELLTELEAIQASERLGTSQDDAPPRQPASPAPDAAAAADAPPPRPASAALLAAWAKRDLTLPARSASALLVAGACAAGALAGVALLILRCMQARGSESGGSRLVTTPLYPDRLPAWLMWTIYIGTAIGMAFLNFYTVVCIRALVKKKAEAMHWTFDVYSFGAGVLTLVLICMLLAFAALGIIFFLAPDAAGSGAPENKGWLNGSDDMSRMFTWRNLIVRAISTVFSNATGFPVGREGPTVTVGSNLAYCITDHVSTAYARRQIATMTKGERLAAFGSAEESVALAVFLDRDNFKSAKRSACAVGGACGMTMIFDSPVGGIIYMFEEFGLSRWRADMLLSAVAATVSCDILMRLLLEKLGGSHIKDWVIFQVDFDIYYKPKGQNSQSWEWGDVPYFVALACALGPFSALHTHLCLLVGAARQRAMDAIRRQPLAKIVDGMAFAALCALVATFVASLGGCRVRREDGNPHHLDFVRFTCKQEDAHNAVASLLVTPAEAAMKLLISRDFASTFPLQDLLLGFLAYTSLNIGLTGIPVPSGNFTGTMLIGAIVGHMMGILVRDYFPVEDGAKPGVYAMMGSAAMLCGFKRMSLAVVVFIVDCGNDLTLIPPCLLVVTISLVLNRALIDNNFDEEQMVRKGVPYLPPEPPGSLDGHLALDLIDTSGPRLPLRAPSRLLRAATEGARGNDVLPVVRRDGVCVGFTTCVRLQAALMALESERADSEPASAGAPVPPSAGRSESHAGCSDDARLPPSTGVPERSGEGAASDGGRDFAALPGAAEVSLDGLMDPLSCVVPADMPAPRAYAFFANGGVGQAAVISEKGIFLGMITHTSLSNASRKLQHSRG
eukprot:TRINITY_DN19747_c0_g1_i1.p1 TRINITY_DN19747_c0_g1~~TRINITY_DN19747_c0_g1_i1.p1  ORF type:complete len:942 (+),score=192.42 TRINITY_DN19747_c0_g1_i1:176-3001(+)